MLHVADMKEGANDNSDTWIQLAAATANLVRYLEKDRDQAPDSEPDKNPENDAERQREKERFLETRLREINRFERSYRNNRTGR